MSESGKEMLVVAACAVWLAVYAANIFLAR